MSEPSPRHRSPHFQQGEVRQFTEAEGIELNKARRLLDDGTAMIVQNVLYAIEDGADRGRDLLNVVVRLIGHLTPEQRRGLAERLPTLLSDTVPTAINGMPHSEAG